MNFIYKNNRSIDFGNRWRCVSKRVMSWRRTGEFRRNSIVSWPSALDGDERLKPRLIRVIPGPFREYLSISHRRHRLLSSENCKRGLHSIAAWCQFWNTQTDKHKTRCLFLSWSQTGTTSPNAQKCATFPVQTMLRCFLFMKRFWRARKLFDARF